MEDPHLREATASQGLTIEEEYNMQMSWREDMDKLTFIACIPLDNGLVDGAGGGIIAAGIDDPPERMIGDVNLYFFEGSDAEDEEDDDDDEDDLEDEESSSPPTATSPRLINGELEVMIALPRNQGRGLGKATLLLFLAYILRNLDNVVLGLRRPDEPVPPRLCSLRAKISQRNRRSLGLFEGLGFKRRRGGRVNYFGEYELGVGGVEGGLEEFRAAVDDLLLRNGMGGWKEMRYVRE